MDNPYYVMAYLGNVIATDLIINRPSAQVAGRLFYASDTNRLYRDNGLSWDLFGTVGITKLSETVLSSPASTVTFSSISGSYRNLMLRTTAGWANSGTNDFYMQFNGDTGNNYQRSAIYNPGSGGTPWSVSTYNTNQASIGNLPGNTAGYPGCFTITVFDYARTIWNKMATSVGAEFVSTSQQQTVYQTFGWNSTAAISSLLLGVSGGSNFAAGSVFSLYGES